MYKYLLPIYLYIKKKIVENAIYYRFYFLSSTYIYTVVDIYLFIYIYIQVKYVYPFSSQYTFLVLLLLKYINLLNYYFHKPLVRAFFGIVFFMPGIYRIPGILELRRLCSGIVVYWNGILLLLRLRGTLYKYSRWNLRRLCSGISHLAFSHILSAGE